MNNRMTRRGFVGGALLWPSATNAIEQPAASTPKSFMDRAFEMRALASRTGDQPYGAVIVFRGRIVAQSASRVVLDGDPTAHAELTTIRAAAAALGRRNLDGCVMYSSSRPCPMCEAAAYWAGLDRFYYGRDISGGRSPALCG